MEADDVETSTGLTMAHARWGSKFGRSTSSFLAC